MGARAGRGRRSSLQMSGGSSAAVAMLQQRIQATQMKEQMRENAIEEGGEEAVEADEYPPADDPLERPSEEALERPCRPGRETRGIRPQGPWKGP